jgi:hypothetical protein
LYKKKYLTTVKGIKKKSNNSELLLSTKGRSEETVNDGGMQVVATRVEKKGREKRKIIT